MLERARSIRPSFSLVSADIISRFDVSVNDVAGEFAEKLQMIEFCGII